MPSISAASAEVYRSNLNAEWKSQKSLGRNISHYSSTQIQSTNKSEHITGLESGVEA